MWWWLGCVGEGTLTFVEWTTGTGLPDPVPPGLSVEPADAVWGRDALRCTSSTGEPGSWAVDGRPFAAEDGVVPAAAVRLGRAWTCSLVGADDVTVRPRVAGGNVLVVILDDIGLDRVASFGGTEARARTPVLDRLRAEGVSFTHAWAQPVCSSARAALLTGRHPHRTGAGTLVKKLDTWALDPAEITVADALGLAPTPYDTLLVGKWHLANLAAGPDHPHQLGFRRVFGSMANLDSSFTPKPREIVGPAGYFRFEWNEDGVLGWVSGYATERTVDDFARELPGLTEPWFSVLSLNAAHRPWHLPPEGWTRSAIGPPFSQSHQLDYMVESADLALGQVLPLLPPDTTVIALADNGTVEELLLAPFEAATGAGKGAVTEAGVTVPMVVWGPLVRQPGESRALVEISDVFDTALAIAGLRGDDVDAALGAARRDSVSLLPYLADPALPSLRATAYTERFEPNGDGPRTLFFRAARDARFKLTRYEGEGQVPIEELFDLGDAVTEGEPVDPDASPEARAAYERLWSVFLDETAPE